MRHRPWLGFLVCAQGQSYCRGMTDLAIAPSTVRIASTSGRLRIDAQPDADISVSGDAEITSAGAVVTIEGDTGGLKVVVPEGVDVVVGSESGRIQVTGRLGHVAITSGSGRVELAHAGTADVRSESGRIQIGTVDAECRADSTTARVTIDHCGHADVSSESGRVSVADVDGTALVHCVSGRIDIGVSRAADVEAETVSGRIKVSFPADVRVHRASSLGSAEGRPADTDCTVATRSCTGRITVDSR